MSTGEEDRVPIDSASRNYARSGGVADRPAAGRPSISPGESRRRHRDVRVERGWIFRERLLGALDAATGPVVIRGEAGAGKSTLAMHWMRRDASRRVARVVFAERDRNDTLAWRTLLASLRPLMPEALTSVIRDYRDENILADDLPGAVLAALTQVRDHAVILLEDLHLVSASLQDRLGQILRGTPELRWVITTRDPIAAEKDDALVAAGLQTIGSAELSFTQAETRLLVADLVADVGQDAASEVYRATRGHVLSTRLAVSRIRHDRRNTARPVTIRESLRGIFDTVRVSLPRFDTPEEARFAAAVALCPEVTADLAERIAEDLPDAWAMLAGFEDAGLGRMERFSGTTVFRFHALITAALVGHATSPLTPEEVQSVRRTAFVALAGVSDPVALLELALDGNLDDSVFTFFARNFSEMSLVRSQECLALLAQLPESRFDASWQLALTQSVLLVETRAQVPPLAQLRAQTAIRNLKQVRNVHHPQTRALLALGRFAAYRVARQYEVSAKHVDAFFRELDTFLPDSQLDETTEWSAAALQGMITRVLAGDTSGAIEVGRVLAHDEHRMRRLHRHSLLSLAHALDGDLRQSATHLAAIEQAGMPANWQESIVSVGSQLAHALQLANRGDRSRAISVLDHGLPDIAKLELWPAVLWVRARIRLATGEAEYGLIELESSLAAMTRFPASGWWRDRLQVCIADLLLATGHTTHAQSLLQQLRTAPDVVLAQSNCALATGRGAEASHRLEQLLTGDGNPVAVKITAGLLHAAADLSMGRSQEAARVAASALRAVSLADNRLPLAYVSAPLLDALREIVPSDLWREPPASPFSFVVDDVSLTKREVEVLDRLRRGGTIGEIAADLFVSPNTLKTHLRNLYRKLGVSTRSEAVAAADSRNVRS